jgi:hypothetical protein
MQAVSGKLRGAPAGHGCAGVCSKDARSDFARGKYVNGIAVSSAGKRRGNGRGGRRNSDIGRRSPAKRSGLIKAGVIASAPNTINYQIWRQITKLRG